MQIKNETDTFEEIISFSNLFLAIKKAAKGHRKTVEVQKFLFNLENELLELNRQLTLKSYRPANYFVFKINDPKPRTIHAPRFKDLVVQHAFCRVLEPLFEKRLINKSYACRKGKGTHSAINEAQKLSRKNDYYLKFDIKSYFDSVDHSVLKLLLRKLIQNEKIIEVFEKIINHSPTTTLKNKGLPLGNLTSQYFANLYLGELDHYIKDYLGIKHYVRFMDDCVVWKSSKLELHEDLKKIEHYLNSRLMLLLKSKATAIRPVREGLTFLGFRIFPNLIRIERKKLVMLRNKINQRKNMFLKGKINGEFYRQSMTSMLAHIKHANTLNLRKKEFIN